MNDTNVVATIDSDVELRTDFGLVSIIQGRGGSAATGPAWPTVTADELMPTVARNSARG